MPQVLWDLSICRCCQLAAISFWEICCQLPGKICWQIFAAKQPSINPWLFQKMSSSVLGMYTSKLHNLCALNWIGLHKVYLYVKCWCCCCRWHWLEPIPGQLVAYDCKNCCRVFKVLLNFHVSFCWTYGHMPQQNVKNNLRLILIHTTYSLPCFTSRIHQ